MQKKVCVVTPDTVGPIKNGGIGTHAFTLAKYLAGLGNDVTVLFVGPCEVKNTAHWKNFYSNHDIKYVSVQELPKTVVQKFGFLTSSHRVMEYLRQTGFDSVHFQEWQACGFHTIQAKRVGYGFENTNLTVTMHSSTEWINDGMRQWVHAPVRDTAMMWAERYCCEHADLLISPSHYMFQWATGRGWKLASHRKVVSYICDADAKMNPESIAHRPDASHLVFFGRLETRKGLLVFLEELKRVVENRPGKIAKVTFLGKEGWVGNQKAGEVINSSLASVEVPYDIIDNFDTFQCTEYLLRTGGVAVVPSLVDNYPFTVIECVINKIPIIAASTGGIPEILAEQHLFELRKGGLEQKLCGLDELLAQHADHKYDSAAAKQQWSDVIAEPAAEQPPIPATRREAGRPLVSVCVPYYNYGEYLPALVDSLKANIDDSVEVIVVDDGSPDRSSRQVFERLKSDLESDNFRFLTKQNGGIGHTRNHAAARARGEYLVFVDADNVVMPQMISAFIDGIRTSGVDCLTCYFSAFDVSESVSPETPVLYHYCPMGPCLELGILDNVFGDANFIVKKSVFEALGGFTEDRDTSWEDYEFLVRLNLAGYQQDVIPRPLFWYRQTPEGFSRNTDYYQNTQRVLRAYRESLDPFARYIIDGITLPLARRSRPVRRAKPDVAPENRKPQPRLSRMASDVRGVVLRKVGLISKAKRNVA